MGLRKKAAKGIGWSVIQTWGGRGFSLIVFIALARLLEPKAFGLVALASVFVVFSQTFLDQGFSRAIVQRAELEREHLDTAFWIGMLSGGLLTVGCIAASKLVADLFHEPKLAPIVAWLSLSFLLSALSNTQVAILRRKLAFKSLAARSLVATVVGGIAGLTMAFLGFGVWSLVAQNLVNGLVGAVVLWQVSDWRPGLNFSKRHFKELFAFGINMVGARIANIFSRRSDDLLIGYFLGPIALGYYVIAYRLVRMTTKLLTGVAQSAVFPIFSRLQNEPERMRRAFYTATQLTSVVSFPALLGVAVLVPELVPALYGPKWGPSVPVMQILAFIGIIQSVLYFNTIVIVAAGKPSWHFGIRLLHAIFNVIAFLLVVHLGIAAVAAAYVIVGYLLSPLSLLAVRRLIQIDFRTYLRQYVKPLTSSLVMATIVLALKYVLGELGLYLQLFIYCFAGTLVYLLLIHLTAPSLSRQVRELIRLSLPQSGFKKA